MLIWYRNYKLISILVPRRMVSWYYGSSITSLHCCNSIPGFQKNLGEISGFYAFGANVGAWEGGIWSMVFVPKLAQYIEMLKTLVPILVTWYNRYVLYWVNSTLKWDLQHSKIQFFCGKSFIHLCSVEAILFASNLWINATNCVITIINKTISSCKLIQ